LLLGWESTFNPFSFSPVYQEIADLPKAERLSKLNEPEMRRAILDSLSDLSRSPLPGIVGIVANGFDRMFPLGDPPEYEPSPDQSIAAMAEREGRSPREVAYDLMLGRSGAGLIYLPILGYADGDLEAIREMMAHPRSVFGLSDGGAHCGLICDASMPTYLLTHWARDRVRGEGFPVEQMVEAQTRRTAELYGLDDRGVLATGMKADVNVIDFDGLHIHAPEMVYDLPAEGRRLIQKVDGYRYTIQSGEVTFEAGEPTGAMPGRVIRGPQASPAAV
jgi:N-acyl-D-aspartate/D-glutamate deacylase